MQNFIKTIVSAIQTWVKKEIGTNNIKTKADWNENDPGSGSYIKNRTHWEETKEKEVDFLKECTIEVSEDDGHYGFNGNFDKELVINQKYTVIIDGEVFNDLTCFDDEGYPTLGAPWKDYSKYHFCIYTERADDGIMLFFYTNSTEPSHTVSITYTTTETVIHTLDNKYLDLPHKLDVKNPTGTGSLSINRLKNSKVGEFSSAVGYDTAATGDFSCAEGSGTYAQSPSSHAQGKYNIKVREFYTMEQTETSSNKTYVYALEGGSYYVADAFNFNEETGEYELIDAIDNGSMPPNRSNIYFMENCNVGPTMRVFTYIYRNYSYAVVGGYTTYSSKLSFEGDYAHVVGNGISDTERSNAHTLDWNGIGWYQGGLQVGGNAQDDGAKNVLLEGEAAQLTYKPAALPEPGAWGPLIYGGGKYFVVNEDRNTTSNAAYSEDSINWTLISLPGNGVEGWGSVVYGNGKFVAVERSYTNTDNNSAIVYSEDGINWEKASLPIATALNAVVYGNGKFVALRNGASNVVFYSDDGVNWIEASLPCHGTWLAGTYGNDKFVLMSEYDKNYGDNPVVYSEDGINWSATSLPMGYYSRSIVYGNGKFVLVGGGNLNGSSTMLYSEDGITWNTSSMPENASWKAVAYGNGKFVATGNGDHDYKMDTAAYSEDGVNWISTTLPLYRYWENVMYDGEKFIAIGGRDGNIVYSIDGINWTNGCGYLAQDGKDSTNAIKDVLLPISTVASPNQLMSVNAVDENKRPTSWKTVDLPSAVSYDKPQDLTEDQKAQARANLGLEDTYVWHTIPFFNNVTYEVADASDSGIDFDIASGVLEPDMGATDYAFGYMVDALNTIFGSGPSATNPIVLESFGYLVADLDALIEAGAFKDPTAWIDFVVKVSGKITKYRIAYNNAESLIVVNQITPDSTLNTMWYNTDDKVITKEDVDFGYKYSVPAYQGTENAGKVLSVGSDGKVALADMPGGSHPEKQITLVDYITGTIYSVYVENGKLTMKEG